MEFVKVGKEKTLAILPKMFYNLIRDIQQKNVVK